MKVDVETSLPPKKEYVLYAPLSVRQREAYDRVLDGGLRKWLIQGGTGGVEVVGDNEVIEVEDNNDELEAVEAEIEEDEKRQDSGSRRVSKRYIKGGKKSYAVDGDDDEYFEELQRGSFNERGLKVIKTREEEEAEEARLGREFQLRTKGKLLFSVISNVSSLIVIYTVRQVNNMKLQNAVMQLRKVCSHPFLFDWPIDPNTRYPVLGEELVNASGKMMVLDRLLRELFRRGHKVLLFSQFTTMLDIIEVNISLYSSFPSC
jgi:ATP-dependent DNA helicase